MKPSLNPPELKQNLKKNFPRLLLLVLFLNASLCYSQIDKTLYWLFLDKPSFMNIYDNSGDQKIVLQFQLQDHSPGIAFTLCAWASYDNDYNGNDPEAVLQLYAASPLKIEKGIILGDQKIKRNSINKMYKAFNPTSGPAANYIKFEPKIDANHHVYYEMTAVDQLDKASFTTSTGHTDPSPPAPGR